MRATEKGDLNIDDRYATQLIRRAAERMLSPLLHAHGVAITANSRCNPNRAPPVTRMPTKERPKRTRRLRLLANLVDRDGRNPITVVNASRPLHPVPAGAQDRNDLTLDLLLALTEHDDITRSRLRTRRWLPLGHDRRASREWRSTVPRVTASRPVRGLSSQQNLSRD
jgi:hypothetical protein